MNDGKAFTYTYDRNGNRISAGDGNLRYEYQYDRTDLLDTVDRFKDGVSREVGYDKTDQVTGVNGSNTEAYSYDKNGNRINTAYVTGVNNRLMSDGVYNYEYDDEGNRTKRTKIGSGAIDLYTWDYRNRLTGIVSADGVTVGYEYDVDDQRISKTVGSTHENYYLDRNQIAFVTDGNGNDTFHYLYGLDVDRVLAQNSSTGMIWSLADRLGSIDLLTDKDGTVVDKRSFDSFGRLISQSNPTVSFRYGYTGRELDLESGLHYYRARFYDAGVGRFISVDPMGFDAGDTNLYRYVSNNSVNATDPSGKLAWFVIPAVIAVGGAAFGAFSNYQYQQAQVADGKKKEVDNTEVAVSGAWGAVGATAGVALATLAPGTVPFLAGLGVISFGVNTKNAVDAAGAGDRNTAEYYKNMAIFDALGFMAGSFRTPPNMPSMQSAMALATSVGSNLSGAGIGASVTNQLFQHFFAMGKKDESSSESGLDESITPQIFKKDVKKGEKHAWSSDIKKDIVPRMYQRQKDKQGNYTDKIEGPIGKWTKKGAAEEAIKNLNVNKMEPSKPYIVDIVEGAGIEVRPDEYLWWCRSIAQGIYDIATSFGLIR